MVSEFLQDMTSLLERADQSHSLQLQDVLQHHFQKMSHGDDHLQPYQFF